MFFKFFSCRLLKSSSSSLLFVLSSSLVCVQDGHSLISLSSNRESQDRSGCEKYNSFQSIFFERKREELCNKELRCFFNGKGITGMCHGKERGVERGQNNVDEKKSIKGHSSSSFMSSNKNKPPGDVSQMIPASDDTSAPIQLPATPPSETNGSKDINMFEDIDTSQIEILMKQQIASSVADTIVNSHQAARKVAKELVIEVLQSKENSDQLAVLLANLFSYPTVQSPIRSLVYFYLHTETTMDNSMWLLHLQMDHYFRGAGKEWTVDQMKGLLIWWSGTDDFTTVVYPLVLWALCEPDITGLPLSQVIADYFKYYEDWYAETLETAVVDYLKSEREHLKVAASEVIKELLISNFKSKSVSDSRDTNEKSDNPDSENEEDTS